MSQWNVTELHMEENRIRELTNLEPLQNLQRLYLGMNRIQVSYLQNYHLVHGVSGIHVQTNKPFFMSLLQVEAS